MSVLGEIRRQRNDLIKYNKLPVSVEMNKRELQDIIQEVHLYRSDIRQHDDWKKLIGGTIYGLRIVYNQDIDILNVINHRE